MAIIEQKIITLVNPELLKKLGAFRHKLGVKKAGFPKIVNWNGTDISRWDTFPNVSVTTSKVYTGDKKYAYSHHQTICKFKGQYVASWSNGFRHEDHFGQQIHYSTSPDGIKWSPYKVLAATEFDEK